MKVSISTKCYESEGGNCFARSIMEVVPFLREVGFECLDLNLKDYQNKSYLLSGEDWEEKVTALKKLADDVGLEFYQAHTPTIKGGNVFGNKQFAAPGSLGIYREAMRKNILAGAMLGVKWMVIHPITCPEYNFERKATLDYNVDFWAPYVELAGNMGVGIAFENQLPNLKRAVPFRYCTHYEELMDLVDSYDVSHVGICWDTGHANQNRFDQYRAITAIGSRLKALHLHDNIYGNKDEHMFPFMGEICWEDVIRALVDVNYEGTINFETNKPISGASGELQREHVRLGYDTACYLRDWLEREKVKK